MKSLYLILVCVVFVLGLSISKVYFSKTIIETKEVNQCEGKCYPADFDFQAQCDSYYGDYGKKLKEKAKIEAENYEEGLKEGIKKGIQ